MRTGKRTLALGSWLAVCACAATPASDDTGAACMGGALRRQCGLECPTTTAEVEALCSSDTASPRGCTVGTYLECTTYYRSEYLAGETWYILNDVVVGVDESSDSLQFCHSSSIDIYYGSPLPGACQYL